MRYVGYFIVLLIILVGVSFAILNSVPVTINYYFATQKISLSLLLAMTFAAGVVLSALVMVLKLFGLRWENRRLRKRLNQLQSSL